MTYEPPEIKIGQQFIMRRLYTANSDGTRTVTVQFLDNGGKDYGADVPPEICNKMPVIFQVTSQKADVLSEVVKQFVRAKQFLNGLDPTEVFTPQPKNDDRRA